jgi:hypothetical protein
MKFYHRTISVDTVPLLHIKWKNHPFLSVTFKVYFVSTHIINPIINSHYSYSNRLLSFKEVKRRKKGSLCVYLHAFHFWESSFVLLIQFHSDVTYTLSHFRPSGDSLLQLSSILCFLSSQESQPCTARFSNVLEHFSHTFCPVL